MTTMLFYDRIAPLNRDNHRGLKLQTAGGGAGFAANTHYVPLLGTEFHQAARDYPILFAGGDSGVGPVAILGLRENDNLFLDADEHWSLGAYVPAFVRRYPFILANMEKDKDEYTVCIDEGYNGFSNEEGTALFDDEGKETAYLNDRITFLNQFQAESRRTRQFVERLEALDLLVTRNLNISDDHGHHFNLQEFRLIDEDTLAKLDDKALGELHRAGFLGWIFAHLISIGNAARMPARLKEAAPDQAPQAKPSQARPAKARRPSKARANLEDEEAAGEA